MAVHQTIERAAVNELLLDPKNPRLGRKFIDSSPEQDDILRKLSSWTLDELATSFLETGFWIQEAIIVVPENGRLYVVEGNRRLAALKLLQEAYQGSTEIPHRFISLASQFPSPPVGLFSEVPYILADTREDVTAYLGFRHVTGIKEWRPAEKAAFISHMIDDLGMTYEEVRRRIGSKTPAVRQNYISYKLLDQIDDAGNKLNSEEVEKRFSVLYRALNATGIQKYLDIDLRAEPQQAQAPVPADKIQNLSNFTSWVFGTVDRPPLFTDSREVDRFAALLENEQVRQYLETTQSPSYQVALEIGGNETDSILELIRDAGYNVRAALRTAHRYRSNADVATGVESLVVDVVAMARQFPRALELARQEAA